MLVDATKLKDGVNEVSTGLNKGINYLGEKGKNLFDKNPVACVSAAFLLGVGAAFLLYSEKTSES